jgi:murein L,D-transpeptidase YafK
MSKTIVGLLLFLTLSSLSNTSFKDEQLKHSRVNQAYIDKGKVVLDILSEKSIDINNLMVYIRAFKSERKIELWAKNKSDKEYQLIKQYDICRTSGSLGPKRKEGDLQIPEGFYHINHFNPYSSFYLSLGLNYPNKSDRILGEKGNLGGAIYIHGNCVTIGCLPITNDKIKELYIFCVEAKNNGQEKIPVTIFPAELTSIKYEELKTEFSTDTSKIGLWADLKKAFDLFNENKCPASIVFLANGRHLVKQ